VVRLSPARVAPLLLCGFSAGGARAAETPSALYARAQSLVRASRLPDARARREQAIALQPAFAEAHYLVGWTYEQEGALPEAAAAYEAAVRHAPRMALAHDRLAFVRGPAGRHRRRDRGLPAGDRARPALADAHYHLGATLWWTKDATGRAAALRAAVRLRPDHAESRYYLGSRCARRATRGARSASCSARSRSAPTLFDPHVRLAALLLELGDADGAVAVVPARRSRSTPASAEAQERARACASWRRRGGGGGGHLPRARRRPSQTTRARATTSAPSLLQRGDLDGRRSPVYRELIRRDPRTRWPATTSGLAPEAEGRLRRAPRASCARRWCSTRGCPRRRTRSASCSGRRDAPPRRRRPSATAIAARADYAEAHYMLGLVRKQEGDRPGALDAFRAAVRAARVTRRRRRRSDNCSPRQATRRVPRRRRRSRSGSRREKADAQAAAFALSAGRASADKGDRASALASLREAVRLDPANGRAHYQLALVLREAGAAREAARHFAEAHRLAPYLPAGPS
jgi:tetratricopeptide (TPR) repeat protein